MTVSTAIDQNAIARVLGIRTEFRDFRQVQTLFLPQHIAIVAQGNDGVTYSTDPFRLVGASAAATRYGAGSPIHLIAKQLFPDNGDGVRSIPVTVLPLAEAGGSTQATGSIELSGTQTVTSSYRVRCAGIQTDPITVTATATSVSARQSFIDAINAVFDFPVTAAADGSNDSLINLTAKWNGTSGNDISIEILGEPQGITYGITNMSGGAGDPDVATALANAGSIWFTQVISEFNRDNTTALDAFRTWGDGQVQPTINRRPVVFTGATDTNVPTLITFGDGRRSDSINSIVPVPGSPNLPMQIAARWAARVALIANTSPARDYAGQILSGIIPGSLSVQHGYSLRDQLVRAGISTTELIDGEVQISDTVTLYHPTNEPVPAFRYVVTIAKLNVVVFNTSIVFNADGWKGAPLIPNDQAVVEPTARKPRDAEAAIVAIIAGLGLNAIISDPATAIESVRASISSQNPNRLDVNYAVQISGNAGIISTDLFFGFFFGS